MRLLQIKIRIHRFIFLVIRTMMCYMLPINKKKIVFDNFGGRGYGDSPMSIANEIIKQGLDYKMVWLSKNEDDILPNNIKRVRKGSLISLFDIFTAKIWVDNIQFGIEVKKKPQQYYIQTWHGGGVPTKQIGKAALEYFDQEEIKNCEIDSHNTNLILSDNSLVTDVYRNSFWLPDTCEIFEHGMPSKDGLFRSTEEADKIKHEIVKRDGVKIALYAPTFRDDASNFGYGIDVERFYLAVTSKFGGEWVVIIRMHPNVADNGFKFAYNDHIIDGTSVTNPQDLVLISDILVTDYSSISSDFLLLEKPVFLLTLDLDYYQSKCRRLHPCYFTLPYPRCISNEELEAEIRNFNLIEYKNKIRNYKKTYLRPFDDGHASEKVVERIKQVIDGEF